jgi:uroporphyrinogen-III synthase
VAPLLVIRPEPGCSATVALARAARLEAEGYPLFEVVPASWETPLAGRFDALLAGSANVFRHGGTGLEGLLTLPVLAVGDATAEAAREAGFTVTHSGTGGLQGLLDALPPGSRRLLRLAGEERIALQPPPGTTIEERVVYASRPVAAPQALVERMREPAVVALHSAEAARHLAAQCAANGLRRSPLRLAALGPRIAAAAGEGWGEVAVAALPSDQALLALARQMCQDPGPRGR